MKQMLLLALLSFLGITGSFVISPLWGLAVYYLFAVLRPQFIWEWVEANGIKLQDVPWSFSVAMGTLVATVLWRIGLLFPLGAIKEPWYGRPRFERTHYFFLAFAFWITLTTYTAIRPDVAEKYFIEYAKIFVMMLCATQVLRTIRDLWVIYYVVLLSAIYAAYEINMYYFVDNFQLLNQRGYGGLDNNGGALVVAMAVPMAYFAWEANRRWFRWGFLLAIPVLVHALQLSFSRGGMVSLGVSAIPVLLRSRYKWTLAIFYVLMAVFIYAGSGKELKERFFSIFVGFFQHDEAGAKELDESAKSRQKTWEIAQQMANERPFLGMGVRNSNLFTKDYGADMEGRSIHSQYLQTAADSGWIGAGLYVGMLLSAFMGLWWVRYYLWRYCRGSPPANADPRASSPPSKPRYHPEVDQVRSLAGGLECALILFCAGAVFLSLEHFEMPYILLVMAMQLHAITKRVAVATAQAQAGSQRAALPAAPSAPQPAPTPAAVTS